MPSINDKFGKASSDTHYAAITTVKNARLVGESVIAANDLSKFATSTPVYITTYRKVTDPVTAVVSLVNQTSWKALVNISNNTLTNVTVSPGYADVALAVGDYIECIPTSHLENDLVDGILTHANQDGTLKSAAVTSAIPNNSVPAQKIDFSTFKAGSSTNSAGNGAVPMVDFAGLAAVSFNLTQSSKVLIMANVDVLLSTNQEFYAQLQDNGTAIFTTSNNASSADLVRTRTINHVATLAAGSHTLTIKFRAFNGGAGSWAVVANTSNIAYMVLGY